MPKISVIVPVFNVEKYLSRCINSILNQSFTDFELILIDDGSTDGSGIICDEYAKKDSRITVIHQNNQGQAAARNKAIDIAKGDYYSFVDSDDYIHPKMFETTLRIINASKCNVVLFQFYVGTDSQYSWEETNSHYSLYQGKDFLRHCLLNNENGCWILCDKLFDRSCFKEIRLPQGRKYEDNAVVYKILYNIQTIAVCDSILYYYYTNPNSTTKSGFSEERADWILVLEEMIDFFLYKNDVEVCDCLTRRYFRDGVYCYNKLIDIYPESKRLNHIKHSLKKLSVSNKKRLGLTIKNSTQLYKIIYPYYSKNYWRVNAIIKKLKKRIG